MTEGGVAGVQNSAPMLIFTTREVSQSRAKPSSKPQLARRRGQVVRHPSPFVSAARFGRLITACLARTRRLSARREEIGRLRPLRPNKIPIQT